MKFMLLMNAMSNGSAYAGVSGWQKNDIEAHMAFMRSLTKSLSESGELVSTEGLDLPQRAKIVRAGNNGSPITDGVFPEFERVPRRLLDRECRFSRAGVRHRRPRFSSARSRWKAA
jgi:hypothetical protein